ncbi:Hypothetical predicted protein [Podarcis lilfordi]|uniref:Uncharacterized protein n=1 Tax=Podarcis lilfordi TaxID=74358 RepID=A0AA35L9C9_9SAUR|nr:Hypothetical predicted protein [Podarcis lilfordi]
MAIYHTGLSETLLDELARMDPPPSSLEALMQAALRFDQRKQQSCEPSSTQMPPTECKEDSERCTMTDPVQLPYQNYQRGDLIIGGIINTFGYASEEKDFQDHPNTEFTDQLL